MTPAHENNGDHVGVVIDIRRIDMRRLLPREQESEEERDEERKERNNNYLDREYAARSNDAIFTRAYFAERKFFFINHIAGKRTRGRARAREGKGEL